MFFDIWEKSIKGSFFAFVVSIQCLLLLLFPFYLNSNDKNFNPQLLPSTFEIYIDLDDGERQTSWILSGPSGVIGSGGPYSRKNETDSKSYTVTEPGIYNFTIYDSGNDGLTDNNGSDANRTSAYSISIDGKIEYSSGASPNFGSSSSHDFN
ncbi:MAG: hypothetical protein KJO50_00120, partial [Bacteroidia bacterium]|nr:hypothetical protein [Bacteroidia bacterium]